MKKIASFVAAAMMALSLSSAAFAEGETNGAQIDGLLVLGDSIATGFGLSGYTSGDTSSPTESFGSLLAANYSLTYGENYINAGVDGLTTGVLLENIGTSESLTEQVKNSNAVVISIGGNDFLIPFIDIIGDALVANNDTINGLGVTIDVSNSAAIITTLSAAVAADTDGVLIADLQTSLASADTLNSLSANVNTAKANLTTILDDIFAANPETNVFIFTVYNPFSGVEEYASMATMTNIIFNSFNSAVKSIVTECAEKGNSVQVIDVADAFNEKATDYTNISALDIHPNAAGHNLIYGLLKTAFDATIEASAPQPTSPSTEPPATEPPVTTGDNKDIPDTGIILSVIPAIAAGAAVIVCKKRK